VQSRRSVVLCFAAAGLFLLVSLFSWFDNPAVDIRAADVGGDEPAGEVGCSIAPWDAGLNANREAPGGEHSSAYSREVAAECYAANMTRFDTAVVSSVLALTTLLVAVALGVRPRRRAPTQR
jgi:hypothetical protein